MAMAGIAKSLPANCNAGRMPQRATIPPQTYPSAIEPAARPLYLLILAIWAVLLTVGYASKLTIDPDFLVLLLPVATALVIAAILKRRRLIALLGIQAMRLWRRLETGSFRQRRPDPSGAIDVPVGASL